MKKSSLDNLFSLLGTIQSSENEFNLVKYRKNFFFFLKKNFDLKVIRN